MKLLILALMAVGLGCSAIAQSASTDITAHSFHWQVTHQGEWKYELYLPKRYKLQITNRWPLMLFLHGIGERGTNVSKVFAHGPIKLAHDGHLFPFIIVAPQCPDGKFWNNTEALIELLDYVEKSCRVDTMRVYLAGLLTPA